MIIAENITKTYKIHGKKRTIFENLSLTLHPGDKLALLGHNGAGKSTLLRVLCGVEKPNKGRVTRTSSLSWPVGLSNGFIANLTGRENIKFLCRLFNCSKEQSLAKINFVQDFAELNDYFEMPISTYSSGMQSRLSFGMSLAFDFDFYVVDETLAVGDTNFVQKSKHAFKNKSATSGLIMVSHDVELVRQFCNQGMYLKQGKIFHSNNIEDIITLYLQNGEIPL